MHNCRTTSWLTKGRKTDGCLVCKCCAYEWDLEQEPYDVGRLVLCVMRSTMSCLYATELLQNVEQQFLKVLSKWKYSTRGLFKRFVGIEGPDNVDTLHFGQWEILGALLERRRY
jgi:hypothetical protein